MKTISIIGILVGLAMAFTNISQAFFHYPHEINATPEGFKLKIVIGCLGIAVAIIFMLYYILEKKNDELFKLRNNTLFNITKSYWLVKKPKHHNERAN